MGKEVVLILFCVLGLDVVLGGALRFGLSYGLLWDLGGASDFVLCFEACFVLGGALWDLYLGFRRGIWEVLCVLVFWRVEILGGLRNGVKVQGGV